MFDFWHHFSYFSISSLPFSSWVRLSISLMLWGWNVIQSGPHSYFSFLFFACWFPVYIFFTPTFKVQFHRMNLSIISVLIGQWNFALLQGILHSRFIIYFIYVVFSLEYSWIYSFTCILLITYSLILFQFFLYVSFLSRCLNLSLLKLLIS